MHLSQVKISNFRLLCDADLMLEEQTTVIVGRNNSGKTSLSEVIRRFLIDPTPSFQLEDFSNASYDGFCSALQAKNDGQSDETIRAMVPCIELSLSISYDPNQPYLGPLGDFLIDLNTNCSEALVVVRYELKDGGIAEFFEGQLIDQENIETRLSFFRTLRERVPRMFGTKIWAQDPNDSTNQKKVPQSALRSLVKTGFVNAQRGLDDNTSKETDVLAKVLEDLFTTALSPNADDDDQRVVEALQTAVQEIQEKIDEDFNSKLKTLIPALKTFGYPGLGGPELQTETKLDVRKLLSNHTKVKYAGYSGVPLPESYNGLGARNLIFILFQLVGFYKEFRAEESAPGVHLIFIEEPEAHLHPQMQEVFIRQLSKIAAQLNSDKLGELPWPVQFVVSTHSSHIANEAGFETIRYFLAKSMADATSVRQTKIKDLREGLRSTPGEHKQFLHQYLTLTRCDLFFADKAVLVEGTSERLLLPEIIKKIEKEDPRAPKLTSQYMTVIEVGGAYAHIFFELLAFLELRFLVITDLDSVSEPGGTACAVHLGTATSNACLKEWFGPTESSPAALLMKTDADKVNGSRRIAFQQPEAAEGPCGRTFEDAFMLANLRLFGITGQDSNAQALSAREKAEKIKKSEFALKYAITEKEWASPRYITDGLKWLAKNETRTTVTALRSTLEVPSDPTPISGGE